MDQGKRLVSEGHMSVAEAARFLDISRSLLYSLMESGQLAYSKFGRSRRVPKRALVEFAASKLQGAWNTASGRSKE